MRQAPFYPRLILPTITKYFNQPEVTVITGMRRVGKTTLLRRLYDSTPSNNKLWIDLEDALNRQVFQQKNYQDIKLSLEKEGINFSQPSYIFLDEIQLVANITSVIKYLYDHFQVKFVVSGSSSFYLKNHFTESLAGRKYVIELFPLTFSEFLDFKNVKYQRTETWPEKATQTSAVDQEKYQKLYQEYMSYGGFPEVVLTKSKQLKQDKLRDIINSYFQIDVASLADFSDIAHLRDLLTLLTQRVGQKVKISNLANVLKTNRQQVYDYLEFLEATYIIKLIGQKSSIDNQVSSQDKVFFTDAGIANLLGDIDLGSQLENSVLMNLAYQKKITYFQTKSGGEIDFILNNNLGLEVKQTATSNNLRNLNQRLQASNIQQGYLVTLHQNLPKEKSSQIISAWNL